MEDILNFHEWKKTETLANHKWTWAWHSSAQACILFFGLDFDFIRNIKEQGWAELCQAQTQAAMHAEAELILALSSIY